MDTFNFWGDCDTSFEHEIAHGHMGRQATNRALRKHAIAIGILNIGRNVCFKKDSAPAPPPDPAIGQAAQQNVALGKDYLDFTKEQWAAGNIRQDQYDQLISKVADSQMSAQDKMNAYQDAQLKLQQEAQTKAGTYQDKLLGYQDEQLQMAKEAQEKNDAYAAKQQEMQDYQFAQGKEQDAYNKATFRPVEGKMVSDAMGYDSTERQDSMAAEAKADVADAAQRNKDASARSMASMGVNPMSGRFAGITRAGDTATALAEAGAQNSARDKVRDMGIMLRKDAANYSKGIASTAAQSYGIGMQAGQNGIGASGNPATMASLGLQAGAAGMAASTPQTAGSFALSAGQAAQSAGQGAIGALGAGNSNFYANNGMMGAGYNTAIGANTSAGNMLNTQYGQQLNAWGMQQQANATSSAGTGAAIGTVVGAGIMVF